MKIYFIIIQNILDDLDSDEYFMWDVDELSKRKDITEKIIVDYDSLIPWNVHEGLSKNGALTFKFIIEHPTWDWNYDSLSSNRHIPFNYIAETKNVHKWNWVKISSRKDIQWKWLFEHFDLLPWNGPALIKNIGWPTILKNLSDEKWNQTLFPRQSAPLNFIVQHPEIKWNMSLISHRTSWEQIIQFPALNWCWRTLSKRSDITETLIQKNLTYWNWTVLSSNKNIPFEWIKKTYKSKNYKWVWSGGIVNNPSLDLQFIHDTWDEKKDKEWSWKLMSGNRFLSDQGKDVQNLINGELCKVFNSNISPKKINPVFLIMQYLFFDVTVQHIVYTIELENNKYYIGWGKPQRPIEHFVGKRCAKVCKEYKPVKILETIIGGTKRIEKLKTLEYMVKYGVANVRGSDYCKTFHTKSKKLSEQMKSYYNDIHKMKTLEEFINRFIDTFLCDDRQEIRYFVFQELKDWLFLHEPELLPTEIKAIKTKTDNIVACYCVEECNCIPIPFTFDDSKMVQVWKLIHNRAFIPEMYEQRLQIYDFYKKNHFEFWLKNCYSTFRDHLNVFQTH